MVVERPIGVSPAQVLDTHVSLVATFLTEPVRCRVIMDFKGEGVGLKNNIELIFKNRSNQKVRRPHHEVIEDWKQSLAHLAVFHFHSYSSQ